MGLPFLIYCSLLKKAQYKNWYDLAAVNSDVADMAAVDQAVRETVEKRLSLAQDFLVFSEGLVSAAEAVSEMANRNAVSRAYYAVHHAIRALLMFVENGDVDGHRESIKAICDLLKRNPALRSKLGEVEDFRTDILELLNRRHLADYYPYGTNAPNEGPLDFGQAAQEAVQFARRVVEKTREFIKLKEAGVFSCRIQSREYRQIMQPFERHTRKSFARTLNSSLRQSSADRTRTFCSMSSCPAEATMMK